jgi:farnesyl diphosphate synthase
VKGIYAELNLPQLFEKFEAESYAKINGLIEAIPIEGSEEGLKREIFISFLAKVYKRSK